MEYLRDANPYPEADRFTRDLAPLAIDDQEVKAKVEHEREFMGLESAVRPAVRIRRSATRRSAMAASAPIIPAGTQIADASGPGVPGFVDPAVVFTTSNIARTNIDPFVQLNGEDGAFSWEAGLRVENMTLDVDGVETDRDHRASAVGALRLGGDGWRARARLGRAHDPQRASSPSCSRRAGGGAWCERFPGQSQPEAGNGLGSAISATSSRSARPASGASTFFYRDVKDLIEIFNTGAPARRDDRLRRTIRRTIRLHLLGPQSGRWQGVGRGA